jgi:predicted esterase
MLFVTAASAQAQPTSRPTSRPAKPGASHVTFTESGPLSSAEQQHKRYSLKVEETHRFNIADESFEMLVPEGRADEPYGLLVWVSPGGNGSPVKSFMPLLQQFHLIWIGANNSGNDRGLGPRVGLALDAVFNLKKQYNIDGKRIYAAGMSGGAKIASLLGVAYPDVFSGAMPICGVIYYRNIPLPSDPHKIWPASYARPPIKLLDIARQTNRFALITGEHDMNREPTHEFYDKGFLKDRFQHVEYIEVPGMGHNIPEQQWIEKALTSLDAPLKKPNNKEKAPK